MNENNKREKIFSAVKKLLMEGKKLNAIKVSEIADMAGIGKGSIYMYFTSKDAVIRDAIEFFTDDWMAKFESYVIDESKDFKEVLTGFLELQSIVSQEVYCFTNPNNSVDYIDYINGSSLPITIDLAQKTRNRYISILESVLNVGVAQNKIQNVNAYSVNVALQAIITMFQYLLFKDCIINYKEYRDLTYEKAYELIYDMILKICS